MKNFDKVKEMVILEFKDLRTMNYEVEQSEGEKITKFLLTH